MIKTINIQLGGIHFLIDEPGYKHLKEYVDGIQKQIEQEPGNEEMMVEIESRMAELLYSTLDKQKGFITLKEVEFLKRVMGTAKDIAGQGSSESFTTDEFQRKKHRRFYRDTDERMLGGVCSGLGAYFDTDPWVFRVLFMGVTLLFLTGLLFYVLIWLLVPEAVTLAQKLEMKGEPVTIESIKESVKEEFEQLRKKMKV